MPIFANLFNNKKIKNKKIFFYRVSILKDFETFACFSDFSFHQK